MQDRKVNIEANKQVNINSKKTNEETNSIKIKKRKLRVAFTKMSLMAMLLIVSTYAWFTSQKDITLSNLRGTVEVAENMEISLDAKTWYQQIDLSDATTIFANAQSSKDSSVTGTAKAILPTQLFPVSGVGEINSSIMPLYSGKATATKLTNITQCAEISNGDIVDNGYFAFDIYIKNTSKDGEDDILQLNLNSAVQVLASAITKQVTENGNTIDRTYSGDTASGLQNTVRVGLALYGTVASSTATQAEILSATKGATVSDVAIWEPNAKDHVEYIVENNNKRVNGAQILEKFTNGSELETYALNEEAPAVGTIENVYDIGSTGLGLQRTFKTEKTSELDYRIKTSGTPLNILSTQTNADETQKTFNITSNTVSRLRVYVWLEGQDVDCINLASQGGGIELDLGLTKDNEVGDVMSNLAAMAKANPSEIYGDYTNYPVDIDGDETDNDWRIFYSDSNNVFLIADSYVPYSKLKSGVMTNDTRNTSVMKYNMNWNKDGSNFNATTISKTISDKYLLTKKVYTALTNGKALASLLNTSNWDNFVDTTYAENAIGGPTIEMFVESWNQKYMDDENYGQINYTWQDNGYVSGYRANTGSITIDESTSLYLPHFSYEEAIDIDGDGSNNICDGYWIAAPFYNDSYHMLSTSSDFIISKWDLTIYGAGIRPIVCLKSNINATKDANDVWNLNAN